MYYKGALPGYSFETHPSLGGDVEVDTSSLKSEAENWINGLQRMIQTVGMHVNSLAPQVVDPSPQIDVNIEAICVEQDCPKRVFLGSSTSGNIICLFSSSITSMIGIASS